MEATSFQATGYNFRDPTTWYVDTSNEKDILDEVSVAKANRKYSKATKIVWSAGIILLTLVALFMLGLVGSHYNLFGHGAKVWANKTATQMQNWMMKNWQPFLIGAGSVGVLVVFPLSVFLHQNKKRAEKFLDLQSNSWG